ncbi:MAG TPA: FHA domain-containing protein [Casimicrobiaceae bacterium]|nr:FHA domain-containing protein [Casimicrobiaceae bacterium]
MAVKRWILSKMNRMNGVVGRPDLAAPRVEPSHRREPARGGPHGAYDTRDGAAMRPEQLGAYAPLVAAIRDELVHFASAQLRLHLAIAERDRYLLTAIEVECIDGSDGASLLQRFTQEFTPEQIKRFLARGVIAQLPNASAIDLTQFGGLNPARDEDAAVDDHAYADLVAQLRATTPGDGPRSFEVRLLGRWTEGDAAPASARDAHVAPHTPPAGARLDLEIEDAGGTRLLALAAAVPNRRYAIGKGEGCDVEVDGAFSSRRHCEIWVENGAWWVADAGSTNGIRVEAGGAVLARAGGQAGAAGAGKALRVVPGARIVLSALATGRASDYPRIHIVQRAPASLATPLAVVAPAASTPVTPIVAPRPQAARLRVTATMQSGAKDVVLVDDALPVRVGRSRNQDLVVDWAHEGVSGRHVEIPQFDDEGAEVHVLGDNGVTVNGVVHAAGERFQWRIGETMTLGRASDDEPGCCLTLARVDAAGR